MHEAGSPLSSPAQLTAALSAASLTPWMRIKDLSVLVGLQLIAGHSHRQADAQTCSCSGDTMPLWRIS